MRRNPLRQCVDSVVVDGLPGINARVRVQCNDFYGHGQLHSRRTTEELHNGWPPSVRWWRCADDEVIR